LTLPLLEAAHYKSEVLARTISGENIMIKDLDQMAIDVRLKVPHREIEKEQFAQSLPTNDKDLLRNILNAFGQSLLMLGEQDKQR
jgi:hypothetical protein